MPKIKELHRLIYARYDSESDLARTLGWERQRLNKITNGVKEPSLSEVSALSTALGVSFEYAANIFLRLKSPNGQL